MLDQRGPRVETVLARERVLRRGQVHRRIGGAQCVETFLGLFAELLERGRPAPVLYGERGMGVTKLDHQSGRVP